MNHNELNRKQREARERELEAEPSEPEAAFHLREMLKQQYDRNQMRPQDVALEKWGTTIEDQITRDLEQSGQRRVPAKLPQRDGPELDMD